MSCGEQGPQRPQQQAGAHSRAMPWRLATRAGARKPAPFLQAIGAMKRLHIAVVYNAYNEDKPELPEDRAGTTDLRTMIRHIARTLRRLRYEVTVLPLAHD